MHMNHMSFASAGKDGLYCTEDKCVNGYCERKPRCDDHNECTVDRCYEKRWGYKCAYKPQERGCIYDGECDPNGCKKCCGVLPCPVLTITRSVQTTAHCQACSAHAVHTLHLVARLLPFLAGVLRRICLV